VFRRRTAFFPAGLARDGEPHDAGEARGAVDLNLNGAAVPAPDVQEATGGVEVAVVVEHLAD